MGNIKWGDFEGVCQLHGAPAERFGTLVDPNGHMWLVCDVCIKALWEGRQALNLEEADKERQAVAVDAALGRLRDILMGGE